MSKSLEQTMTDYGLSIRALVADETLQRCGTARKPKSLNGWYIIYDGGKSACFGNWELGDGFQFWREDGAEYSPVDRGRIEQLKIDREKAYDTAAIEAESFLDSCAREGHSDYLAKKKIDAKGIRYDEGCIIIPMRDADGKIWSYQRIYGNGAKYFMTGGKVKGCYFTLFSESVKESDLVVVCEGFATGATIHQVTNLPVIVAFSAGNLKAVCESIPYQNLLIAADNDESGTGEKYASESGYKYVMPTFIGHDYSDLYLAGHNIKKDFMPKEEAKEETIRAHGLVAEIADWITATSIRPQPLLSLAASLAFIGMIKGHKIRGGTNLRTNVLILSLAPTAGGKEHPQHCIMKLMDATDTKNMLLGEPVSGAGFLAGLKEAGGVSLMIMDEMGRYLSNIMDKRASGHQREIVDYIIKTFSCANSFLAGKVYANKKMNPKVNITEPHFCCLGSTVAERLIDACSSSEVIDGFLNRWILFNVKDRPARNPNAKYRTPPASIVDKVNFIKGGIYAATGEPAPEEIRFTAEAWDIFNLYRDEMDTFIATAPYPLDKLYSRASEHVEKLALILCNDAWIEPQDVRAAIQIVNASNKAIRGFSGLIADNPMEKDYIRVREIIREAGYISKNELTRRTQFIIGGKRRREEILEALLDDGLINIQQGTSLNQGKIAEVIRWRGV